MFNTISQGRSRIEPSLLMHPVWAPYPCLSHGPIPFVSSFGHHFPNDYLDSHPHFKVCSGEAKLRQEGRQGGVSRKLQEVNEGGEWPRMGEKMMGSGVSLCAGADTKTCPSAAAGGHLDQALLLSFPAPLSDGAHHP